MGKKDIFEDYYKETKCGNFTQQHYRSFGEDSWSETIANKSAILKFAEWYATRSDETFKATLEENKRLTKRNAHLENRAKSAMDNANATASFLTAMLEELANDVD